MKVQLTLLVPGPAFITRDLKVDQHPDVEQARAGEQQAREALVRLRLRAASAVALLPQLRNAVSAGRATSEELESGTSTAVACYALVATTERTLALASGAVARAEQTARADILRVIADRRDELQAIAEQLAPTLELLRASEIALYQATHQLGARWNMPGVTWPESLTSEIGGLVLRGIADSHARPDPPLSSGTGEDHA